MKSNLIKALTLAALLALPAGYAFASHTSPCYFDKSGKRLAADSGCTVEILSGATLQVDNGAAQTINGLTLPQTEAYYNVGFINKFRNPVIDVWQRPASVNTSTSYTYGADGWEALDTGAVVAMTRTTTNPRTGALSYYSLLFTGASSNTDVKFAQNIESYVMAPLVSQNVTVQFEFYNNTGASYAPLLTASNPTTTQDTFSAVTAISGVSAVALQTCANATWCLESYTFAAGSSTKGLQIAVDLGALTSGNTAQVTEFDIRATPGVTVGLNSAPPTIEIRPVALELPFDQRYLFCTGGTAGPVAGGFSSSTTASGYFLQFPVPMRAAPTAVANTTVADFSVYTYAGASVAALSGLTFGAANTTGVNITSTVASGLTTTTPYLLWAATGLQGNSCFTGAEL